MRIILILMLILVTGTVIHADEKNDRPAIPEIFTLADLQGENPEFLEKYFIISNFEQRLQLATGKLSKKLGRVLVLQKDDILYIAFYFQTDSGKYRKIGRTIAVKNTSIPRQDTHPEYNIPCLVLSRTNGQGIYRVYLYNGQTVIQKGETETTKKD